MVSSITSINNSNDLNKTNDVHPNEMCKYLDKRISIFFNKLKKNPAKYLQLRASKNFTYKNVQHFKKDNLLHIAARLSNTKQAKLSYTIALIDRASNFPNANKFFTATNNQNKKFNDDLPFFVKPIINECYNRCKGYSIQKSTDISLIRHRILGITTTFEFKTVDSRIFLNKVIEFCNEKNLINDESINAISPYCASGDHIDSNSNFYLCKKGDTILHVLKRLSYCSADEKVKNSATQKLLEFTKSKLIFYSVLQDYCNVKNGDGLRYDQLSIENGNAASANSISGTSSSTDFPSQSSFSIGSSVGLNNKTDQTDVVSAPFEKNIAPVPGNKRSSHKRKRESDNEDSQNATLEPKNFVGSVPPSNLITSSTTSSTQKTEKAAIGIIVNDHIGINESNSMNALSKEDEDLLKVLINDTEGGNGWFDD